jgi:hypothetical protein
MRVYANNSLIAKKGKFGRRLSMVGLVILGLGMLASFAPGLIEKNSDAAWAQNAFIQWVYFGGWLYLSLGALIFGFALGQFGNYYMRRFLKPRRPDLVIARTLKGFDDRNRLYVWASPIDLAFAGPAGVYAIIGRDLSGEITIRDGKIHTPFSFKKLLSFFGDESGGRPLDDAKADAGKLADWLNEQLGDGADISVKPLVVFTSDKADLTIEDADVPVLQYKQLKSFLRSQLKSKPIPKKTLQQVIDVLDAYAEETGAEPNLPVAEA